MKPLRLAFGAISLTIGVQVICLVHIITSVFIIAMCTSVKAIVLVGIVIPPWKQVSGATWVLVGMPLIIQGGVGALYRIKTPVMNYFYYLLATCVVDMLFLASIFYEADMCKTVAAKEFVSMGPNFVCGIADSLVFMGFLFGGLVFLYFCFIVWSCAQEIAGWKPALLEKAPQQEYDDEEEHMDYTPQNVRGYQPGYAMPGMQPMMPGMQPMMPGMQPMGSFPMPMKGYGGMGGGPQGGPYGSMGSQPMMGGGGPRPTMPANASSPIQNKGL